MWTKQTPPAPLAHPATPEQRQYVAEQLPRAFEAIGIHTVSDQAFKAALTSLGHLHTLREVRQGREAVRVGAGPAKGVPDSDLVLAAPRRVGEETHQSDVQHGDATAKPEESPRQQLGRLDVEGLFAQRVQVT